MKNLLLAPRFHARLVLGAAALLVAAAYADLLTPLALAALRVQWHEDPQTCIKALELHATPKKKNADLNMLQTGRLPDVRKTYAIAASVMGDDFWRLVATAYPPAVVRSCERAEYHLDHDFPANRQSLYDATAAYKTSPYAGLAKLELGASSEAVRDDYRACFDYNAATLFQDVATVLGN